MGSIVSRLVSQALGMGAMHLLKANVPQGKSVSVRKRLDQAGDWEGRSRDGVDIAGWSKMSGGRCTVVLAHGFLSDSRREHIVDTAELLSRRLDASVVAVDLRSHGDSGAMPPSFGEAESWDLATALDYAEARRFPRPFMLYGVSLGGMAARLCAIDDSRVAGAYLSSPPACARVAVSNHPNTMGLGAIPIIGELFNQAAEVAQDAYGWDILDRGDARLRARNPAHHPMMMVAMGSKDPYGHRETLDVWRHNYPRDNRHEGEVPPHADKCLKWFKTIKGAGHFWDEGDYPDYVKDMLNFYRLVIERHKTHEKNNVRGDHQNRQRRLQR